MSKYKSEGWYADETIALIATIKELELQREPLISELKWDEVVKRLNEKGHHRSGQDLSARYNRLKYDYFTARWKNRSCEYYNFLHDLLFDQQQLQPAEKEQMERDAEAKTSNDVNVVAPGLEEEAELEHKYAHTLEMEYQSAKPSIERTPQRCKWADGEVETFLNIITSLRLQGPIQRKRNDKVFKLISREMSKRSMAKRPEQLRIKYEQLKKQYIKSKNSNGGNKSTFEHLDAMRRILSSTGRIGDSCASDTDSNGSEDEDADIATGSEGTADSAPISKRCKWADGEVAFYLNTITTLGLKTQLLRKRNAKVFKVISKEMTKNSFEKTPEQLRIKYHQLRRQYHKILNGSSDTFEHFETMNQLLNPVDAKECSASESDSNDSDNEDAEVGMRSHPDSYYWTDVEVDAFLIIIKEHNLFRALDGSKKRNFKTLLFISNLLAKQGFKRTPHQLRNKLRLLMKRYKEAQNGDISNVRMLPRHFQLLDDIIREKRPDCPSMNTSSDKINISASKPLPRIFTSDSEQTSSTCDLLRANADSEDDFAMLPEPTPLEVLTSISEGQKELLAHLKTSNENFFRQQLEMQRQFLQEMSAMMRQEREETFRMLRQLLQPRP